MNNILIHNSNNRIYTPYKFYRNVVWAYLLLLIFEGALRKWFLPGLATPLLIIRDPLAAYLTYIGISRGWLKSNYIIVMFIVSILSLLISLVLGHQNLMVGLFGWRIYTIHFPTMFVIARVLTRNDLLKMIRFILYVSIPMTILIVIQFYSPPSAWVNRGIGGEGTAGFATIESYSRPPGTFSFTAGYVCFQAIVGCLLLYYLIMNKQLSEKNRIPNLLLLVMTGCYLLSIPISISRTHFFQTCVFLLFLGFATMQKQELKLKYLKFIFIVFISFVILIISGVGEEGLDVFIKRFEGANKAEGGIDNVLGGRYLGAFFRAFNNLDIPMLGYGIGLGTNVGAHLMGGNMYSFGFNAEEEWSRITGECGILLGLIIISIRTFVSLDCFSQAYKRLIYRFDLLPWMLSAGMLLLVPQGQWSIPTNLGFCILSGGFTMAAIRTTKKRKQKH